MESEENFEKLFAESVKDVNIGKTVTGKIVKITKNNEIFVDLGYKADGIIPYNEYSFEEGKNPNDEFKVGDEITADVLKMNDGVGNVLLSYKKIRNRLAKEQKIMQKEKFWNEIQTGDKFNGKVTSISSYGAFVEIADGVQGLLHVSEMSWERNINPNDILEVNQEIDVTVKELDKENRRLKLTLDAKGENPWNTATEKYNVNDVVKVKIVKFMTFGAFAEIEPGIQGLIHISQISEQRIAKPEDKLEIGQEVNAKILNIDVENKKLELSIKELEGTSNDINYQEEIGGKDE